MTERVEVAVVGAGPGGLTAALAAAFVMPVNIIRENFLKMK